MTVKLRWVIIGMVAAYAYGKWRMLTTPIDEYHALRMDMSDSLNDLNEELNK